MNFLLNIISVFFFKDISLDFHILDYFGIIFFIHQTGRVQATIHRKSCNHKKIMLYFFMRVFDTLYKPSRKPVFRPLMFITKTVTKLNWGIA